MSDRQAGAADEVPAALRDLKAKAAALTFRSHQDALDYASHVVEEFNRRSSSIHSFKAIESYCEGRVYFHFFARSKLRDEQYEFFFYRIPSWLVRRGELKQWEWSTVATLSPIGDAANAYRQKGTMLLGITELVYGPEGVIPSFVWLEASKERFDFRGKVPANFPFAVDGLVELVEAIREGEIGLLQSLSAAGDSGSVSALIKRGPKIIDRIENDTGKYFWQRLGEFDLVDFLSRIRVRIDNEGPWLFADKSINEVVEITNVMMCPYEGQSWAMEQIGHEREIRPDERFGISEGSAAFSEYATATP